MRIIQMMPTLSYGDAVGNDALAIKEALRSLGYKTELYAENISSTLLKSNILLSNNKLPKLNKEDVVIYHYSTGTKLNTKFADMNCKKIMRYHNITPPEFFKENNSFVEGLSSWGLRDLSDISGKIDYCLADSEFNKKDLEKLGYKCKIDVLPILIPFHDYEKEPNKEIIEKYNDGNTNLVFTGRVAPNKKHEDIIKVFYFYKKYCDRNARLFLVGAYDKKNIYYQKLIHYIEMLDLEDVYFTGHIAFNEILSYYKLADVFICMSEHEGFCVPLAEAMWFKVPIVAYNSTAIPYTLGGSGIVLDDKNPLIIAKVIERVIKDSFLAEKIVNNQTIRLKDFEYDEIRIKFDRYLKEFLKNKEVN